jgi:glycosidase
VRTICGGDLASVRLATLLQMTLPGAPCIYYGDEIGMEGAMDPDCRRAFPIDPAEWLREPHAWTAGLVGLRHSSRALRDGDLSLLRAAGPALAYLRRHEDEAFACVLNAGDEPLAWDVPVPEPIVATDLVSPRAEPLSSAEVTARGAALRVALPARDGAVFRLVPDRSA